MEWFMNLSSGAIGSGFTPRFRTGSLGDSKGTSADRNFSSEGNLGLSKSVRYYIKHKDELTSFVAAVVANSENFSEDTIVLANRLSRKFSKYEVMDKEAISDPKIRKLLLSCNVLQRQYLQSVANNGGAFLEIPLLLILKEVDKLDRLVRKVGLSHDNDQSNALHMCEFITKFAPSTEGFQLKKCSEETASQVYFISNGQAKAGRFMVFKPIEGDKSAIRTVPSAERYKRQMAAYLLDLANHGKVNVPLSVVGLSDQLEEENTTLGSLQIFRKNNGPLKALDGGKISSIPTDKLHLMSIHRGRLYDLDAHLGNVLHKDKEVMELVPIDFDFLLPQIHSEQDAEQSMLKMGWRYFPQMDKPFSEESLMYLRGIDLASEMDMLSSLALPPTSIRLFQSATLAFQIGAELGLTPGEMIDYLASAQFKEIYLETYQRSVEGAVLFDDEAAFLLSNDLNNHKEQLNADKELYAVFTEKLIQGDFEGAIGSLDTLYFIHHNSRLVFTGIRQMILSKAPQEEVHKAIDVLKTVRSTISGDIALVEGYGSVAAAFEQAGRQEEADFWKKEFALRAE